MRDEIFPIYAPEPAGEETPKRRAADTPGHYAAFTCSTHEGEAEYMQIIEGSEVYIVDIENIDPEVPKAQFSTPGSACLDLYTREEVTILGNGFAHDPVTKIPLNVKVKPRDRRIYSKLYARSSTCLKYKLMLGNAVGIIDNDFNDEVCMLAFNFGHEQIRIPKGTKIAQLEFCKKVSVDIQEGKVDTTDDHKGFGSTGK